MTFEEPDPGVLEQAKRDVQRLVTEMERLAQAPIEPREFFAATTNLLQHTLHAVAVGVWWKQSTHLWLVGDASLSALFEGKDKKQLDAHEDLLAFAGSAERPMIYGANAGPLTDEPTQTTNPIPYILIACPIRLEGSSLGILEIFVSPDRRPHAYAGYQRLAMKATEEIANFHRNRRYRQFAMQEGIWNDLDRFIRTIHGGLSTTQTCYVLANSGRALIGCERVSVALKRGSRSRITAVSGQDVVDRKANLVRQMTKLSDEVLKHGETFIYEGIIESSWPQTLSRAMEAYAKESSTRVLIAMPLVDDRVGRTSRKERRAVLIAEVITDEALPTELAGKVEVVAKHGALAVYNALDSDRILFLPLWRFLGNAKQHLVGSKLPRTILLLTLFLAALLSLVFVPWTLNLDGKGELLPKTRRLIYAPRNGLIREVNVDFASEVSTGSELATVHSPELMTEIAQLRGEIEVKQSQCEAMKTSRSERAKDMTQVSAKIAELESDVHSLEGKLDILNGQLDSLRLRSPIAGRVLDWEPKTKLLGKMVQEGESLLEIADAAGEWIVEVRIPERSVTHIARARGDQKSDLPVTLVLASAPERTYRGSLFQVATQAAPLEGENVCLAKIRLDEPIPEGLLLARSEVHAKVDCGKRSLGYVLFRDVIDFVREKLFL